MKNNVSERLNEIGYPVVLKIASPDIIHKSDAGGVKVGLNNNDEVQRAFRSIIENARKYVQMQRYKAYLCRRWSDRVRK